MCAPSLTERTDSKKLEISPGLSCRERKHCSCWGRGGSREDAVSRTTPRQTILQGAETEMHSGHSVLGYLVVCCFLQPYPRVRTLTKSLFLLFAIILAPFIGLVRIYSWIWLVKGTEHMATETAQSVSMHAEYVP